MTDTKVCNWCKTTYQRPKSMSVSTWRRRCYCSVACQRRAQSELFTQRYAQQRADLVEDVEWLLSWGEWPPRIAERVGKSIETVQRALFRAGRHDLAQHFKADQYRDEVAA